MAASVYTEMNAITKGVSLGIYADGKQKGVEASRTGSQPYVELMGRRSVRFSLSALHPLRATRTVQETRAHASRTPPLITTPPYAHLAFHVNSN